MYAAMSCSDKEVDKSDDTSNIFLSFICCHKGLIR